MVSVKIVKLNIEMVIEIQADLENKVKVKVIEDGILQCLSRGLYEEEVSIHIKKFKFHVYEQIIIN
jgi:hypothetical protein